MDVVGSALQSLCCHHPADSPLKYCIPPAGVKAPVVVLFFELPMH